MGTLDSKCYWRRSYEAGSTTFTDVPITQEHGLYLCTSGCEGFNERCKFYSSPRRMYELKIQKEIREKYPALLWARQ
jgi:hypothetical protein